jgi:hypothetical protein
MRILTMLSALLTFPACAERDSLQIQCASLRATLDRKDLQIEELADLLRKTGAVAKYAINRAESSEAQLAELRDRIGAMAMVYPWAAEKTEKEVRRA